MKYVLPTLLFASSLAFAATTTVTVPSTAGPWSHVLNPSFDYTWAHDNSSPIVIDNTSGIVFTPGATISVTYISGTVTAGAGYPAVDANGQQDNITNTYEGFNGRFPAFYMNAGPNVYLMELVGTFANNGAIVGVPFAIGNGPTKLTVPTGANQLLLGINDNFYADNSGSFTVTVTGGTQLYNLCLLYDPTKAVNSGATLPIKLQLCDANGNDASSSTVTLHATSITKVSDATSNQVQDSGNANPDSDFRFDRTLGPTGGYIFNLSTKGVTTGTYNLNFTVTGDSFVYTAPFRVK